jgi:ASC-1-like (ASCH) protein
MKVLFVKKKYLELILAGKKTLETRVMYPNRYDFLKGDTVYLNNQYPINIVDVRKYPSYEDAIEIEGAERIIPGADSGEALEICNRIYPAWKQKKYGVLVIEISSCDKKEV